MTPAPVDPRQAGMRSADCAVAFGNEWVHTVFRSLRRCHPTWVEGFVHQLSVHSRLDLDAFVADLAQLTRPTK